MASTILSLSRQYPCWDSILQHLDLNSIKHLRLANREIAASCLTPWFLRHVESRTVELLPSDKGEALKALREHPFSTHVRRLTIRANVYDSSYFEEGVRLGRTENPDLDFAEGLYPEPQIPGNVEEWRRQCDWMRGRRAEEDEIADEETIRHLAETFQSLKSLHGLSLDVRLCYGPGVYHAAWHTRDWPLVRRKTSWLFDVVVASVAESGALIEEFDGYFDSPGCAVSIDSLAASLRRFGSDGRATPWDAVRELSLRVCRGPLNKDYANMTTHQRKEAWVEVFAGVLTTVAELESLSIHVYDPPGIDEHCEIFRFLAQDYTQRLRRCSLRHLPISSTDLTKFLAHQSDLEHLELSRIALLDADNWQPFLLELPQQVPKLQHLKLAFLTKSLASIAIPMEGLEMAFMMSYPLTLGPAPMENLETGWMNLREETGSDDWKHASMYLSLGCEEGALWHTMTFSAEDLRKGLDFLPVPGQLIVAPQSWLVAVDEVRDCRPQKVD